MIASSLNLGSEYLGYLTNKGCKTALDKEDCCKTDLDKAFSNVENLSQETLVQKTKEKQLKATVESCNDNSSNSSNRISSFAPTYHPIIKNVHKVIRNTLRVTLESSDSRKQILPEDSIKLSSKRDRKLKEILAPAVPHDHRQKRKDQRFHRADSRIRLQ